MIAETRAAEADQESLLMESGAVTVSQLQTRFGISPMTARRDLEALEQRGSARRTHGGAVLPSLAAPEDSFTKRVGVAADAKLRLADAAFELLKPGETVFLDSSSTAYFLARRIAQGGRAVRVLTNSGPVMQVLTACEDPQVELYVIGGVHRRLTGSFVGPSAVRMIREHFVDAVPQRHRARAPPHADGRRRSGGGGQAGDDRAGAGGGAAARRVQARDARQARDRAAVAGVAGAGRRAPPAKRGG